MEYIDIVDENNIATGEVEEKKQVHTNGKYHRTVHVWIINDKKELLLQKRSATKENHPNYWDISCAGHISTGETAINGAIRELQEELGIKVSEEKFEYLETLKSIKNTKNREFAYVYLIEINIDINKYIFEDNEVSEVKYVYYKKLEKLVSSKQKDLLMHDEEYSILFKYLDDKYSKM
ncbi:MAG: NUDIX domain-containing protein [Clostridia bacterium]|nr:NUDIX domain-containing protein [Clostridia bacterium]MDD4387035.1 NUDIX domain-containing protein [Clostridia bacterium]